MLCSQNLAAVMHFGSIFKNLLKHGRNDPLQEPPVCKCVCVYVCGFGTVQMSCCSQVKEGRETRVEENERSLSGRVLSCCVEPLPSLYQRYGLSQAYVPLRGICTDP